MSDIFRGPRNSLDERIIQDEQQRQKNLSSAFIVLGMGAVALLLGLGVLNVLSWALFPGLMMLSLGLLAWLGNLACLRRW